MKQDLRVAVTKRMIQEALIRLLKNKPIDKIKVNELCEESGINRATFYRHYETLQDILREIEADVIRAMPQPRQKPRTLEDARAYLKQVCTYIYDNIGIMQILLTNRTDEEMMQYLTMGFCVWERTYKSPDNRSKMRHAEPLRPWGARCQLLKSPK